MDRAAPGLPVDRLNDCAVVPNGDDDFRIWRWVRRVDRDVDPARVYVGDDFQVLDRCAGDRFQPDGLPDAGGRRVHDAAGMKGLLAARLSGVIGRIKDPNDQLLRSGFREIRRDIVAERQVAAPVNADAFAVDIHLRFEVHRAKVQQDLSAFPGGRHDKGAPIPQPVVMLHDA